MKSYLQELKTGKLAIYAQVLLMIVALFSLLYIATTRNVDSAFAQCADGWMCFGTRVLDIKVGCNRPSCTQAWSRNNSIVCPNFATCTGSIAFWIDCYPTTNPCATTVDCSYERCWTVRGTNCSRCGSTSYLCNPYQRCVFPHTGLCNASCAICDTYWHTCSHCNTCNWVVCETVPQTCCVEGPDCAERAEAVPFSVSNCCVVDPNWPPPPPPPVCDANPGAPTLLAPIDGSTIVDNNVVNFTWSANGWGGSDCGSRSFRIQVDNNSDFSSPEYNIGGISSATTSRTITVAQPEDTYYWRVRATNENGSTWSGTFSFILDYVPPTAEFTNPTSDITAALNTTVSFTAIASDPGGAMTRMQIARHNTADAIPAAPDQAPATLLGADEACAGANCTITRTWDVTNSDIGTWSVYVNAYDVNDPSADGKCTGSSSIPGGWGDCDTGNNPDLITVTVQNTDPRGRFVAGPTTATAAGVSGGTIASYATPYNTAYDDNDRQVVTSTWSSPNCTINYEEIDHIDIRTFGDFGVGAWPVMDVEVGDPFGASYGDRSTACSITVDSNSWTIKTCNINQRVSSLDILFQNDASGGAGDDRNLYLDWIDIYYTDGSVDRVQAEHRNTSGNYVWIDQGFGDEAYDGLSFQNANQSILVNSAIRFPVPISFSPASSPFTCRLQATPRDSLGAVGNTVFRDVDVCGAAPTPVTNPSPSSGEENVLMPITTTWDAPTDWGDACGVQINRYTVYARQRAGGCLDPNPADYTALPTCTDLVAGNESCSDPFFNVRDTEFCWYVEASNNQFTALSATTGAQVWWFETVDPITYQEWMTTLYGDFYAGSVSMEFPDVANYIAPWIPPHMTYEDDPAAGDALNVSALSSNDIDITTDNPDAGNTYYPESHSSFYAKFANFTHTWPANYNGDPPADVVSLPRSGESCDDIFIHDASNNSPALEPDEAYVANVSCVQDGLDNYGGDYRNQNPGVVVLYVTGSGDLRFDNDFLTSNDNYRVLFVTGSDIDVKIDRSLDSGDPDFNSTPLIEASFIVNKSFEFEGVAPGDEETDPDTSLVVEGPIITRSILFSRNRGVTNTYPSEIIRYNGDYLPRLTMQERTSSSGNYTGLFVVDVDWISEE